jgi:hypothetical protein
MTPRPALPPARARVRALATALALALAAGTAAADPQPMDDEALSEVHGAGVAVAVHLELNSQLLNGVPTDSRITLGFNNNGTTTYAVLQNLAGIADIYTITLNMRQRTAGDAGSDYFDISLPQFVGFKDFGVRALAVTTDPNAPITTANSYGSVLLNGVMNMQGHFYLWPR